MNIPGFRKLRDNNPRSINKALEKSNDYFLRNRGGGGSSYLVYTALLNQSTTNAPVATELINTIGNIVWTYDGIGYYIGTLTGAFTAGKTTLFIGETISTNFVVRFREEIYPNQVAVYVEHKDGTPTDGILDDCPIEIRVYP